ncbi:hypothetical protein FACS18942_10280 [Planctomycetales bacterium]|nr:hypothetical protein FACS18942_10280 [Planctomycetales bacterium]GHT37542.1 hypothetical protein FACS189427_10610 [Planctomycetales bacterium]
MSNNFAALSPKTLTVKNLLGDKNLRYLVPDYQREYRWQEDEQCETLWNDLTDQFLGNPEGHYYLGSIIAHRNEKRLCIIDGQQRLITLSLFLRQLFGKIYGQKLSQRQQSIYFGDNEETVDTEGNSSWFVPSTSEYRIISEVLGEEENAKLRYALDIVGLRAFFIEGKNIGVSKRSAKFDAENVDGS